MEAFGDPAEVGRELKQVYGGATRRDAWLTAAPPVLLGLSLGISLLLRTPLSRLVIGGPTRIHYTPGIAPPGITVGIGVMAGMFGLGAGWANVPVLNLLMGAPLKISVATSKFLLSITDTSAAWIYLNQGCVIPMMVVPVVVGYNFSMIFIDSGPLNQMLAPFLEMFGVNPRIRWLSHPVAAQWALILADVWQWTSLTFLIFLSGFSALPQQLLNAARVMGANRWQIFWRVQLPLLKPAIIVAVVIRCMEALKLFDQAVLLTFGGPGAATETVAFFLWRQVWMFNKYSFGQNITPLHLPQQLCAM